MVFIKRNWLFFVTIFVALPVVTVIAFELAFWQKIYFGVKIAGWDVAGMSQAKAEDFLRQKLTLIEPEICFKAGKEAWCVAGEKIKLEFHSQLAAKKAFQVGRQQNFWGDLEIKGRLLKKETNLPLVFDFDEGLLMAELATPTAALNQPVVPPLIEWENREIKITPGKKGQRVDKDQLIALVRQKLGFLDLEAPIEVPITPLGKDYSPSELIQIRERAARLLGKSIILASQKQNLVINDRQLINFVGWEGAWNFDQIDSYLKILSEDFDQPAKNALFKFEDGKVVAFALEEKGWKLDLQATRLSLISCLESFYQNESSECIIELQLSEIEPEIRISQINQFGITQLVGRGESFFRGSPEARIYNLTLASERISGKMVAPGEIFSFNQAVGEISAKTGYKTAYIIQNGRTVLGDGGGVCQVSTTLFRAALNTGLPIIERQSHAYRVHYYEDGFSPGFDATVFAPSVDLKFKNDLPSYLLIQAKIDKVNKLLVFEFYGTSDNRRVEISKVKIWDQVPPAEDLYVDDFSLPLGTIKQIDFKAWGAKTVFDWKVYKDGELINEKSFYSYYRPWRAIFLRGTGGR